jgi:hypothetical protein
MLAKATHWNKAVMGISIIWLTVQGYLGYTGFYLDTVSIPPHFAVLFPPVFIAIAILFNTKKGKIFIDSLDLKTLTLLHTVRIPVEFCLLWLFMADAIPQLMTFEGRNFDIVAGITAPVVFFLYFIRNNISKKILLGWNVVMLLFLINIIVNALLSAPLPFQQFAFHQPNVGILYLPYVWLPSFIVPAVFFSHLVAIRRLK